MTAATEGGGGRPGACLLPALVDAAESVASDDAIELRSREGLAELAVGMGPGIAGFGVGARLDSMYVMAFSIAHDHSRTSRSL